MTFVSVCRVSARAPTRSALLCSTQPMLITLRLAAALLVPSSFFSSTFQLIAALPNIVVFISDDHTLSDRSVYGAKDIVTPHMDRLAAAGMTFEMAFAPSPSCAPSRGAMLTGLMPARNGAEPNHSRPRASIKKLPAYLQELDYEVTAFGRIGHYNQTADYGFDHVERPKIWTVAPLRKFFSVRPTLFAIAFFQPTVATAT